MGLQRKGPSRVTKGRNARKRDTNLQHERVNRDKLAYRRYNAHKWLGLEGARGDHVDCPSTVLLETSSLVPRRQDPKDGKRTTENDPIEANN